MQIEIAKDSTDLWIFIERTKSTTNCRLECSVLQRIYNQMYSLKIEKC